MGVTHFKHSNVICENDLTVEGALTTSDTDIAGDTTVTGTFDVTGDSTVTGTFDVTGNTTVVGTFGVSDTFGIGGDMVYGADVIRSTSAVDVILKIPISYDDGDQSGVIDTGVAIPQYACVYDIGLFVDIGEAQTIDVGVTGNPDGYIDGLSIANAGFFRPTLSTAVAVTLGADLTVSGVAGDLFEPDFANFSAGSKNVVYTAPANLSTFVGVIFIKYTDYSENKTV